MKYLVLTSLAAALSLSLGGIALAQQASNPPPRFTLSSPMLKDGGDMPLTYVAEASTTSRCGGADISPPLNWSNAPSNAKSFAMIMYDIDGRQGMGVDHWIAYGIPSTKTSLAEGEGNAPPKQFLGGLNNHKEGIYLGPCPGPDDPPHHYLISVFALDISPGDLSAGLSREELMNKMKGRVLGLTSIVVRYGR